MQSWSFFNTRQAVVHLHNCWVYPSLFWDISLWNWLDDIEEVFQEPHFHSLRLMGLLQISSFLPTVSLLMFLSMLRTLPVNWSLRKRFQAYLTQSPTYWKKTIGQIKTKSVGWQPPVMGSSPLQDSWSFFFFTIFLSVSTNLPDGYQN